MSPAHTLIDDPCDEIHASLIKNAHFSDSSIIITRCKIARVLAQRRSILFSVVLYKAVSVEVKFSTILRKLALSQQQT
ncbi:hypothetical protein M5G07_01890 [Serratia symbiotica]|nr:hypothetical protein [Serratia symbiotica]